MSTLSVSRGIRGLVVVAIVVALSALALSGCWGGAKSSGGSDKEHGSSSATSTSDASGTASSTEAWKQTLLDRLAAQQPGRVFNTVGNTPHAVAQVDASTNKKTTQTKVDYPLAWVAMKPDGSEVWCTPMTWDIEKGLIDNPIAVIDPATGKVKAKVKAHSPNRIAFSPDGTKVYVTLVLDNAIAIYDSASKKEIGRIPVGKHPLGIAVSFDGKRAYVSHGSAIVGKASTSSFSGVKFAMPKMAAGSEYVAVVDLEARKVVDRVDLGGFSAGVAVSPDGSLVYATVSSVDPLAITGGTTPLPGGAKRWDGVAAISTKEAKVIKRMKFASRSGPSAVAFTPDGKKAYAICGASDSATPIDAVNHTLKKKIALDLGG